MEQKSALLQRFNENSYPTTARIAQIGEEIGMPTKRHIPAPFKIIIIIRRDPPGLFEKNTLLQSC